MIKSLPTKRSLKKLTKGITQIEKIGILKNELIITSPISIIGPYCSNLRYDSSYFVGRTPNSIFEPSKGGIGNILKIARTRFIITAK